MKRILFPSVSIAIVIALTVISLVSIKSMDVESKLSAFLPAQSQATRIFNKVSDQFGGNEMALVVIKTDNVFKRDFLKKLRDYTKAVGAKSWTKNVISLANTQEVKKTEGGIEIDDVMPLEICDGEVCEELAARVLAKEQFVGKMVSADGTSTAVMITLQGGTDFVVMTPDLEKLSATMFPGDEVFCGGLPVSATYSDLYAKRDMERLVPIALLLILLIILIIYRKLHYALLPVVFVSAAIFWTFGLMSMLDKPVTVVTVIIPIMMLAVGNDYLLHALVRFREQEATLPWFDRVVLTIKQVGGGIMLAAATTVIGFLSMLSSHLTIMSDMGVVISIGMSVITFLALTVMLMTLSLFRGSRKAAARQKARSSVFSGKLSAFILAHSGKLLLSTLVVALITAVGIFRIERAVDLKAQQAAESPALKASDVLGEKFSGDKVANIYFEAVAKGGIKSPGMLNVIADLELRVAGRPEINSTSSIAQLIMEMNFALNGEYRIPDTAQGVESLWLLIDGKEELSSIIDKTNSQTLISAMTKISDTKDFLKLSKGLEQLVGGKAIRFHASAGGTVSPEVTIERLELLLASYKLPVPRAGLMKVVAVMTVGKPLKVSGPFVTYATQYFQDESLCELEDDAATAFTNTLKSYGGPLSVKELLTVAGSSGVTCADLPKDLEALMYKAGELDRKAQAAGALEVLTGLLPPDYNMSDDMHKKLSGVLFNHLHGSSYLMKSVDLGGVDPLDAASTGADFAGISGLPLIISEIDGYIVEGLYLSIVISLLAVFLLLALYYRSIRIGLLIVLPLGLSIAIFFGIMGLTNIPLSFATAMLGAIALGVGIDYNIHFFHRLHQEYAVSKDLSGALTKTYFTTGRVILANAVSTGLGMLILVTSSLVPLQQFGFLTAMTMFVSFLFAMFLTPALIIRVPYFRRALG